MFTCYFVADERRELTEVKVAGAPHSGGRVRNRQGFLAIDCFAHLFSLRPAQRILSDAFMSGRR